MLRRLLTLFQILVVSSVFGIWLSAINDSGYPFTDLFKPFIVLAAEELNSKPNSDPLSAVHLRKRNGSYAISVESVRHKLKEKQDILLVDARNKEEFETFSIPGSVNIPLFAIKTKSFLKEKSLVLINEGYNYDELERACEDLRESGFTVWVLRGGLYFWKEKGGRLKGDPFAQKELNKMPPSVFFTERDAETWRVIDVSSPENREANAIIPQAISVPFSGNETEFISALSKIIATRNNNQNLSFLICNEKGEEYARIEKLIQNAGLYAFFLKGGIKGYEDFLERQATIKQAKHSKSTTIEECSTCP
jgi:rhodanese-related sulfurtransferase